jgi:hypothetical protein
MGDGAWSKPPRPKKSQTKPKDVRKPALDEETLSLALNRESSADDGAVVWRCVWHAPWRRRPRESPWTVGGKP